MPNEVDIAKIVQEKQLKRGAPEINWGGDFEAKKTDEKVAYLKKFANSFNHALDQMQDDRNLWRAKAQQQERLAESQRNKADGLRKMMQNLAKENNETKEVYQTRITALENRIRELEAERDLI
jgi:uncharacterized FlgJ-related protein